MRVLIQRVSSASVQIADKEYTNIGRGLLILLGIENEDLEECLSQEWDSFCEQCEGRLGEDKNLAKAFKMLRGVFDTLQW